ncbi:MAG: 2-polyprenyl-6-methoxyphenol hydroxylase [Homoserinimonas sp.]|jgi:salicylate hydroxylase|nr:2-polyprenyl-6-methoxyphenol hydroxylase [Homoserinimonas sp.]
MFAAKALLERGVDVAVYEQALQIGEIGAGVQLTPNSLRLLERVGLLPEIERLGVAESPSSTYYRMDGTPVAPVVTTDSSGQYGVYGMHRADLLSILADSLPSDVINVGHKCVGLDQDDDGVRLSFANGATAEADVVIGADGIHSVMQKYVSEPSLPVDSGKVAYRGLIPAEKLPAWPANTFQLWMGEGKHFLVFPVRGGTQINYVGFVPSNEHAAESWSAVGDPAVLAAEFAGWDPRIEELLTQVETTFWWGLYDREPLQLWTNNRLTLLGDAAHPMLPHLGQGANQSIEDGAALAMLLAEADRSSAPRALVAYEALRRERTTAVQIGARANGLRYDSDYEDLGERDAEIAASKEFRLWVYDYDAELATSEEMAKHGR